MSKKRTPSKKVKTTTTVVTETIDVVDQTLDTHYVLILDRSGSMSSCWDSTIAGLNEQLNAIRDLEEKYSEQRYFVSLLVFDNIIEYVFKEKPIGEIKKVKKNDFPPRNMTALYDAMGIGINDLAAKLKSSDNELTTGLVVVMTDGWENASKEHGAKGLKKLIKKLEKKGRFTISFMGANQDAVLTAKHFGISKGNVVTYASTEKGAALAFDTLTSAVGSYANQNSRLYVNAFNAGILDTADFSTQAFMASVTDGSTDITEDEDSEDKS